MKRIFITCLSFLLLFSNLLILVYAGLSVSEGSIEIKGMEKKSICGIACIFSVYETPSTYKLDISGELSKFVEKIEPDTFTLTGIQCPGESEARRACISKLCNDPNSTSTKMPCVYFNGPTEFSFDVCNGLPCSPKTQKYEGSIKAIGSIGAATTVEPLAFIVYYTPISGWPILAGTIILAIIIILLVRRKIKKVKRMFCEKCGKWYKKSIRFCPNCGSSLLEKEK
jgi:hypothetical protein